jgi:hypothetical protein
MFYLKKHIINVKKLFNSVQTGNYIFLKLLLHV